MRDLMHLAPRLLAVATVALLATGAAQAQKIRPGLWENSVTMKSNDPKAEGAMAQMQEQLARMSPEQRAQMEAMMARSGMGMAAGKPTTLRVCITPEMAARDQMHAGDGRCKSTGHSRSGSTVRFKFSCDSGDGKTADGEGEFTLVNEREHKGKMSVNSMRQGQAMRMDMESSGRWVAADCGDIKPIQAPK